MGKRKRLVLSAALGLAAVGVMVAGLIFGTKYFWGGAAGTSNQDISHLPQQARNALEDIAAVVDKLSGIDESESREEVEAIRSSLAAMDAVIRELPSDTQFSYGQLLQAEIAGLLERCVALRRRGVATSDDSSGTNPDQHMQELETLVAQRRESRHNALESGAPGGVSTVIEIRTKASPTMLNLESELEQLRAEVERQRQLQQQQILETEFELDQPDIEKLLVAFTTPGMTYTTPDGKKDRNYGVERSVSLTFLKKYGCLKSNRQSLERLLSAATRCKRPRGHLPRQWGGDMSHLDMGMNSVQRAEQLLIKYGELLIKKGMLSP